MYQKICDFVHTSLIQTNAFEFIYLLANQILPQHNVGKYNSISKFNKEIHANQILYLLIVTMRHSIDPVRCYLIDPVSLT